MNRNHLLIHSMKILPTPPRSVWSMTMEIIGQAFGVPASRPERRP